MLQFTAAIIIHSFSFSFPITTFTLSLINLATGTIVLLDQPLPRRREAHFGQYIGLQHEEFKSHQFPSWIIRISEIDRIPLATKIRPQRFTRFTLQLGQVRERRHRPRCPPCQSWRQGPRRPTPHRRLAGWRVHWRQLRRSQQFQLHREHHCMRGHVMRMIKPAVIQFHQAQEQQRRPAMREFEANSRIWRGKMTKGKNEEMRRRCR